MSGKEIDLGGEWRFRRQLEGEPGPDGWDADFEAVSLVGTTDENEIGERRDVRTTDHLARPYSYEGTAWYQRDVRIPEDWAGKRIALHIERTRATQVWVDGEEIGGRESLTTEQVYDLTEALHPGERVLTVQVDNASGPLAIAGVQNSHMATEHTQTNWNGLLGEVTLRASAPVRVADVWITTDVDAGIVTVETELASNLDATVDGTLSLEAESRNAERNHSPDTETVAVTVPPEGVTVETEYGMGDEPLRWDEFEPAFYDLAVSFAGETEDGRLENSATTTFGMRTFDVDGTQFEINGTTVFLRGTTDCCVFPETGYAPTSIDEWRAVFRTASQYGINHYRFHSWCPPEAAFRAADELGVYLQPELPQWDADHALEHDEDYAFYCRETQRILDAYGNHPSFVLFALGNELAGDQERMAALVEFCREYDGRHLYAQGSNNFLEDTRMAPEDDFWVTTATEWDPATLENPDADPKDAGLIRGSTGQHTVGHVNNALPSTDTDYADVVEDVSMPLVSHEIGQYQVYPDFERIGAFDGVLEANNFKTFERHLSIHGMDGWSAAFQRASGALAVRCYREEIEAALRTPGFGGFQLLQLQDFPGQGTATVGLLDAHMDSKELVDPGGWRAFCAPVVPLARLERRVWTVTDELGAEVQVANYGPDDRSGSASWEFLVDGTTVASGDFPETHVEQGTVGTVGTATVGLDAVSAPTKATLAVSLHGGERNEYDVWVFPDHGTSPETGPVVRRRFDEETRERLRSGDDVLLVPSGSSLPYSVEGTFQPDFWNYDKFNSHGNPGTLGLYCRPNHPALAEFPTDGHADWQWWRLLSNARPVILDDVPSSYRPIAGMVDTFVRNHKLGVLFEANVGDGNLLVCTIDLLDDDSPEALQLFESLRSYVDSAAFDPDATLHEPLLAKLLTDPNESA